MVDYKALDPHIKEILRKRALALRVKKEEKLIESISILLFTLSNEWYAFYTHEVEEIINIDAIRKIPGTHPAIIGVMNLRGRIISLIDLHELFGIEKRFRTPEEAILLRVGFAVLVDDIYDILSIQKDKIKPVQELRTKLGDVLVSEFEWAGKLVGVLSPQKIVESFKEK